MGTHSRTVILRMKRTTIKVFLLIAFFTMGATPTATYADTYGNDEFLDAMDVALTAIVDSGDYDTIFETWFEGEVVLVDDTDTNTATTYPTATSGGTLDDIIDSGKIVFGSDTTYPPFESIATSGEVVGFDADIADAIAAEFTKEYGETIVAEMMTTDWDPIIPNLIAGEFDAILSAMTKTPERAQQIDFTRAYYSSSQGVLRGTLDASSVLVETVDDLNNATIKIAVQTGTTSDLYAQDNLPLATVQGFSTFDLVIAALENGDVHVALGDTPVMAFYETANADLELVDTYSDEDFGLGVRKDTTTGAEDDDDGFLPFPFMAVLAGFMAIVVLRRKK